ncbi:hypothetical protein PF007_g24376 [Phytophthora fragariae]|uniref:RxLR effector protein n=1 Tax=Phytophthora fragariae TaxID=53985 RepID=A0A6A4B888_9STRA|nr:hypothetical protein PF003_g6167 [Phytophthora fragariae]KAE8925779.1 hypothetical protein PF009_g24018 [Phytophthora fragariae]KAE9077092.1 hypothetical protein PF007_g24376 [Phytophthora fragariae]KAE9100189.1 hypothetical protein PF006_g22958 [Phytophthora fragariae]KAE9267895.1 hypothetical protein PF001_g29893 [Phytophthora fragariae]
MAQAVVVVVVGTMVALRVGVRPTERARKTIITMAIPKKATCRTTTDVTMRHLPRSPIRQPKLPIVKVAHAG